MQFAHEGLDSFSGTTPPVATAAVRWEPRLVAWVSPGTCRAAEVMLRLAAS